VLSPLQRLRRALDLGPPAPPLTSRSPTGGYSIARHSFGPFRPVLSSLFPTRSFDFVPASGASAPLTPPSSAWNFPTCPSGLTVLFLAYVKDRSTFFVRDVDYSFRRPSTEGFPVFSAYAGFFYGPPYSVTPVCGSRGVTLSSNLQHFLSLDRRSSH